MCIPHQITTVAYASIICIIQCVSICTYSCFAAGCIYTYVAKCTVNPQLSDPSYPYFHLSEGQFFKQVILVIEHVIHWCYLRWLTQAVKASEKYCSSNRNILKFLVYLI